MPSDVLLYGLLCVPIIIFVTAGVIYLEHKDNFDLLAALCCGTMLAGDMLSFFYCVLSIFCLIEDIQLNIVLFVIGEVILGICTVFEYVVCGIPHLKGEAIDKILIGASLISALGMIMGVVYIIAVLF